MIPRASLKFIPTRAPLPGLITKFGGQPGWLDKAQWPTSRSTGRPMRFIGQIALDVALFPNAKGKMAYIFMTDEDEYVDGTWEADGGENAVIIQPGSNLMASSDLAAGPTLYEMVAQSGKTRLVAETREYEVDLTPAADPPFQPEEERGSWSKEKFEAYAAALDGNKIGGTPIFLQGDEFPSGDEWRLLLQLDSTRVPFYVNFGDAGIAYAFINSEGSAGKLLWQCA